MGIAARQLRQRDGTTCGPTVAVVAGALLDPTYRSALTDTVTGRDWFAAEQARVHASVNRVWPRMLGTTPMGMAHAITVHARVRGRRYRWRSFRGRRDRMADVQSAVRAGWPVAMLIGAVVPRHWVLIVKATGDALHCYEPSSGEVRVVDVADVRNARLTPLGYRRPFAFVLPRPSPRAATT
ncbi:hypothetical protein JDV09_02340 [Mycobacterium sp. Y57]|uniref:hypothetical protein n=1 Tax=Mycolicibacterium xanthum TaxID=2796469 RepID=UPI001C85032B|nr:hypothetical protein [Mycolicibacterium xanthum]MBX7430956.1 hypothetical protein [Mycolicibacterium xanthum]